MIDLNLYSFIRDKLKNKRIILIKDEIEAQIQSFLKGNSVPKKKFILFSVGRSGTEVLRNMLNLHPDIYCDKELFLKRKAYFPKRFLENRSKVYGKSIYGYKAKVSQLEEQYKSKEKIKTEFLSDDYQIIYVRRKNFVRQALSGLVSNQRKKWHDTKSKPLQGDTFTIDCQKLLKKLEWIERCEQKEREVLEGLEYLPIIYEEDILPQENHQRTLDRIFEYLGVDSIEVTAKYRKTTPKELSEFIENHNEVIKTLGGTRFARYLNDQEIQS